MHRRIGFALLLLLLPVLLTAQEQPVPIKLEQVLQIALGRNEAIKMAKEDLDYSHLIRSAAWSAFVPSVTLNGSLIRNDQAIEFPFGDDNGEEIIITIQSLYDYSYNVNIGSPLYKGGTLYKSVEQTGINIGLAEDNLTLAQNLTIFQVCSTYALILKAERLVRIKKEFYELAKNQLELAKKFFAAGEAVRTSVSRAEAQVALADGEQIAAQNESRKTRQDLMVLVDLPEDFIPFEVPLPSIPSGDLDSLVTMALQKRTEFGVMEKQLVINNLEIEKAFGQKLPQVDWNFRYAQQRAGFPTNRFWQVALNASWKIFDSGMSSIVKAQHEVDRRKIQMTIEQLKRNIRSEVMKAYMDYTSILEAKRAAQKQLVAARLAFTDIEKFYVAGEATDLDVENLRMQMLNAQIAVANTETDEKISLFLLRFALGLPSIEIATGE